MARMPRVVSARDALIEENIGLVVHIAGRISTRLPHDRDRDDLVSAGFLGLVEAASRFDPERGMPFASFAGLRIEGAILDSLRSADRLPRAVRHLQRRLDLVETQLTAELGRTPTSTEVAGAVGMSVRDLHEARTNIAAGTVESIDRGSSDDLPSFLELLTDAVGGIDDRIAADEAADAVRRAVLRLPERHRFVILGCMFEGRPLRELAVTLGVTRSRVSQLKDEAIRQLRIALADAATIDLTDDERVRCAQGRRPRAFLAV